MQEIKAYISKLTFSSFCDVLEIKDGNSIEFQIKVKDNSYRRKNQEIFRIEKNSGAVIIKGAQKTLVNLRDIYGCDNDCLTKNFDKVLQLYNIVIFRNTLNYVLDTENEDKMIQQILNYLCGINFLYLIKLFDR